MMNFENMMFLLDLLNIKHNPKNHWCVDNVSWGMVEALHTIFMQATKLALDKANAFVLFCDEVILVQNTFLLSIYVHSLFKIKHLAPQVDIPRCVLDGSNEIDLIIISMQVVIIINGGIFNWVQVR
jgi:hypothetical protein